MPVSRTDIERALDEMISNEEGVRFQRLATRLAQQRWPDLIASEPKKDLGADAKSSGALSATGEAKVLACSITAKFDKIKGDAKQIKTHFTNVKVLIFATPRRVSNETAEKWSEQIRESLGYEFILIPREEIVNQLMEEHNSIICQTMLHIPVEIEADLKLLVSKATQATSSMTAEWFVHRKLAHQPLINLRTVRLDEGYETRNTLTSQEILDELLDGRRIVIEAPAGRGKTTTLIQLATRIAESNGLAFLIDLPEWAKSGRDLLEFIADMPPFVIQGLNPKHLLRVSNVERISLLFNGWNELSEEGSELIENKLRKVDREFLAAGILVATRTHSIRPPLAGALHLSLLPLTRAERADYLNTALAERAYELISKLQSNRALDELTRTPFILREVTKIFRSGNPLPTTKFGILDAVMRLFQGIVEHHNELLRKPLSGNAARYLEALATRMTALGDVTLSEMEARSICNAASDTLKIDKQLTVIPESTSVLDALCAHHVLERIGHPATSFRFEHQQFQEFYAALFVDRELDHVPNVPGDEAIQFAGNYINLPSWEEPLRMVAEKISIASGESVTGSKAVERGGRLIEMALFIDPVLSADLARLSGSLVWQTVAKELSQQIRALYASKDANFKQLALAAMFASGSDDFKDITHILLNSKDKQVRLETYRVWPEFHLSSLGQDWQKTVAQWDVAAREEFASEITLNERRTDIAEYFCFSDPSIEVRTETAKALLWIGSDDLATKALQNLPQEALKEALLLLHLEELPSSLREHALEAYRSRLPFVPDPSQRIRLLLSMLKLGEKNVTEELKEAMQRLPAGNMESDNEYLKQSLEIVQDTSKEWVSEWVATRIISRSLWHETWLHFVTTIPQPLKHQLLTQIKTQNLEYNDRPVLAVLSAVADTELAEEVFAALCQLRREIDASGQATSQDKRAIFQQLEEVFRAIEPAISIGAIAPIFTKDFDDVQLRVVAQVFSRTGRDESDLRGELPADLRLGLRLYLKNGIPFASAQNDVSGSLLANLASILARIGDAEDMPDLQSIINADLRRLRDVRDAISKGQRIHGISGWSMWNVRAVILLDREQAEFVLLPLLKEEEYQVDAAKGLLQLATVHNPEEKVFPFKKNYEQIWNVRDGSAPTKFIEERRKRFASALNARVAALLEKALSSGHPESYSYKLQDLAAILAALDSLNARDLALAVAVLPARWHGARRVEILETLLFGGVRVSADTAFNVLNPIIEQAFADGLHDNNGQHVWLLKSCLCLLLFVDDSSAGISLLRDVLDRAKLASHDLADIIAVLGHSRSPHALKYLRELAEQDPNRLEQIARSWIGAVSRLGGPEAKNLLLAFLVPHTSGFSPNPKMDSFDASLLASRIAEIAHSDVKVKQQIFSLSTQGLSPERRFLLLNVFAALGTPDALLDGLDLAHDGSGQSTPYQFGRSLENLFLEQRPYGSSGNTYTVIPRSATEVRRRLFDLVLKDSQRRKWALALLARIEAARLERGRPVAEPRHPNLRSGVPWPPLDFFEESAAHN